MRYLIILALVAVCNVCYAGSYLDDLHDPDEKTQFGRDLDRRLEQQQYDRMEREKMRNESNRYNRWDDLGDISN